MDTAQMFGTIGLFAAFIAALTQNVKTQLGIKGRALLLVSVGLGVLIGCVLAAGGIMDFRALRRFPDLLSGGVLGALSGLGASGGTDWAKNITVGQAEARARFDAQYRSQGSTEANPTPEAEWQEVDLATYSRTDWPATAATENPNWRPQ